MIALYTILVVAAIGTQAFFTASEMAFTSANRVRIKSLLDSGDPHARKLDDFLRKEGAYLGTTLVGTNMAVVISSVLATRIFMEHFAPEISPLLATAVMVPVTLIFAEIVPKMVARQFSTSFALRAVAPLTSFFRLFHPLIVTVNSIARFFIAPFGKEKLPWHATLTKSDLKKVLALGYETGEVEADEVELIHKVLDFGMKKVGEIMVPLYRLSSINASSTTDDLKSLVSLTGFSRIPVYRQDKNNIVGIVNIYDILFKVQKGEEPLPVENFIREPIYISGTDSLDIALARLRHRKQPMGIVTDKDNNAVGIVTMEDILEEIVGEIEDKV